MAALRTEPQHQTPRGKFLDTWQYNDDNINLIALATMNTKIQT